MPYNLDIDPDVNPVDDKILAKALTLLTDEYARQNYGCAFCHYVRYEMPHTAECPITIATRAIKALKTRPYTDA